MRVMVTGANGFVGGHVVRSLIADGHDVLAVDALRYGPPRFDHDELRRFRFEVLDLRQADVLTWLVGQFAPDAVIHLAAIHFIPECERHPGLTISTNVEATANLALACPSGTRLVLASSAAVYRPGTGPHREDRDETAPADVYGFSKLWAEQVVRHLAGTRGLEAVLLRLFNVIGPGETNPHLLPALMDQVRDGQLPVRLGNTTPRRDYIYVGDAADAFIAAALRPLPEGDRVVVANVGTGRSHSVLDVVAALEGATGAELPVQVDPERVRTVDRPELCADTTRMTELFGWSAGVPFAEAVARAWRDHQLGPFEGAAMVAGRPVGAVPGPGEVRS
jgi:UDP-glucose 4-epimerase